MENFKEGYWWVTSLKDEETNFVVWIDDINYKNWSLKTYLGKNSNEFQQLFKTNAT